MKKLQDLRNLIQVGFKLLTIEKDQVVVAWVLTMQKVGLSIDEQ
jgi:hypothetical protein